MERFAVGEVVLLRFPFSDLSSKKLRPALVLAKAEFNDLIVCQITSRSWGKESVVPIDNQDFLNGGLPIASFARPDKLFTLDSRLIKQSVGQLGNQKMLEIKEILARIFEI